MITEFLPPVGWAGKNNTISCGASHHIVEGRWLCNRDYVNDYINYWYTGGEKGAIAANYFSYSHWISYASWQKYLVDGDKDFLVKQLPAMMRAYKKWVETHGTKDNLFWSYDVRDGMEESISGSRKQKNRRATTSSYLYGEAVAISKTATLAGKAELAREYLIKADSIKLAINMLLWDEKAEFYKVLFENDSLSDVRELHGYVPWYFAIPPQEYSVAWKNLMDRNGFYSPYGPTTAEQRHPGYSIELSYTSRKACRWDGPVWPFSTSQTLTAMAVLLNDYQQEMVTKQDYYELLKQYATSHKLKKEDGTIVPWIDESMDPRNGTWITHERFEKQNFRGWGKGGELGKPGRGKDYNHSTFCDLVISGLIGIRPTEEALVINPLVPDSWDYFSLSRILYKGKYLSVCWDRTGEKYGVPGFRVYYGKRLVYSSGELRRVVLRL